MPFTRRSARIRISSGTFPIALLIVGTLSGCRLYGGHGTTEAIRADLTTALQDYRTVVELATQDLGKIENAASSPAVARLGGLYAEAASVHARRLDKAEVAVETAMEHGGYRRVSRLLGSIVSERTLATDTFRSILVSEARTAGVVVQASNLASAPPIQAVPAYYQRTVADLVPGVDEILAALAR